LGPAVIIKLILIHIHTLGDSLMQICLTTSRGVCSREWQRRRQSNLWVWAQGWDFCSFTYPRSCDGLQWRAWILLLV